MLLVCMPQQSEYVQEHRCEEHSDEVRGTVPTAVLSSQVCQSVPIWPVSLPVCTFGQLYQWRNGYRHGDGGCSIMRENKTRNVNYKPYVTACPIVTTWVSSGADLAGALCFCKDRWQLQPHAFCSTNPPAEIDYLKHRGRRIKGKICTVLSLSLAMLFNSRPGFGQFCADLCVTNPLTPFHRQT